MSTGEYLSKESMAVVENHIDDPDFETDDLARQSGYSRRQLNRKLRALTGESVRGFICTIRLKRAAQLLQQQNGTVTEIAYRVGFNNLGHFAKLNFLPPSATATSLRMSHQQAQLAHQW